MCLVYRDQTFHAYIRATSQAIFSGVWSGWVGGTSSIDPLTFLKRGSFFPGGGGCVY